MQPVTTVARASETVVAPRARHWKNVRTRASGATAPAAPRAQRVDAATTADVMAELLPVWSTRRVAASRVRQRVGAVMKWTVMQGHCDGAVVCSDAPREARVPVLAHVSSERVEVACRRSDLFDRHRVLVNDRAAYGA